MIGGINHITFAVTDLSRSVAFYEIVLGANVEARWSTGAYISLAQIWVCLSLDETAVEEARSDYTHIAFSVERDDLDRIQRVFRENNVEIWKENRSEGDSIYFLDPDGHKLELHVGTLESRLKFMSTRSDQSTNDCGSAF